MSTKVLLITPPFTQLNTPYPATAYLKGFLNTKGIIAAQMDLGIEVILQLFSKDGLTQLFEQTNVENIEDYNSLKIYHLQESYIATIDSVIGFLQNKNPTLAHQICNGNYLPEASRFEQISDLEWAFGNMGIQDKAKHLATLFLEDIGDYIVATTDPNFGFSRYAEKIAMSANSFDSIEQWLLQAPSHIEAIAIELIDKKIKKEQPDLLCISMPFPGNLIAGLRVAQYVKQSFPEITISIGGGYPNTELRSISDPRIFNYIDFISLDDGEAPLLHLIEYINNKRDRNFLKRTFGLENNAVVYYNASVAKDYKQEDVGTPDFEGLPIRSYISVIEIANPMHRLWSDGRWNKLTLAHGCYWGKCTFCDISLDYISNYEFTTATVLVDRIEAIVKQTGETGFHFVDEAAPPALMKAVAIELIKRNVKISWWTNIRFEKSFTRELCILLAESGCIAVSGGLEVATDRLLKLMKKGVTVAQVARVANHFTQAGIMVHAYLMYGFPTQTAQETIDALEVVRQLFENEVIQSGFWHQFSMTTHSPIGMNPDAFEVQKTSEAIGTFANNDLEHIDPKGCNHIEFSEGLRKSLYNYMHGVCLDFELQEWFDFDVPKTSLAPFYIEHILIQSSNQYKNRARALFLGTIGNIATLDDGTLAFTIFLKNNSFDLHLPSSKGYWLIEQLEKCTPVQETQLFQTLQQAYEDTFNEPWDTFMATEQIQRLLTSALLIV